VKVGAVPVQVGFPFVPAVKVVQEKMPVLFEALTVRNGPGVGFVTVNVAPEV
jgi:hypothetical protein